MSDLGMYGRDAEAMKAVIDAITISVHPVLVAGEQARVIAYCAMKALRQLGMKMPYDPVSETEIRAADATMNHETYDRDTWIREALEAARKAWL